MAKKAENMKKYNDLKVRLERRVTLLYRSYKRGVLNLDELSPGLADMVRKLDESDSDDSPEPLKQIVEDYIYQM